MAAWALLCGCGGASLSPSRVSPQHSKSLASTPSSCNTEGGVDADGGEGSRTACSRGPRPTLAALGGSALLCIGEIWRLRDARLASPRMIESS